MPIPVDATPGFGYTKSMKTAVSIPDDIFNEAETLAKELKTSRSDVYARALAAFVGDHSADRVTQAMNAALDIVDPRPDLLIIAVTKRANRIGARLSPAGNRRPGRRVQPQPDCDRHMRGADKQREMGRRARQCPAGRA